MAECKQLNGKFGFKIAEIVSLALSSVVCFALVATHPAGWAAALLFLAGIGCAVLTKHTVKSDVIIVNQRMAVRIKKITDLLQMYIAQGNSINNEVQKLGDIADSAMKVTIARVRNERDWISIQDSLNRLSKHFDGYKHQSDEILKQIESACAQFVRE